MIKVKKGLSQQKNLCSAKLEKPWIESCLTKNKRNKKEINVAKNWKALKKKKIVVYKNHWKIAEVYKKQLSLLLYACR